MQPTSRRLTSLAIAAVLGTLAAEASGQCGVKNSYRIANSYSGASSELNVSTPWMTTAPLSIPGFNDNPGASCYSHGSCTPYADYGYLRVTGTGGAQNCASSGVFLYLDQQPQASFRDTLTVMSSTLPPQTPVQLRLTLAVAGHAWLVDSNPSVSVAATLSAGSVSLSVPATTGTQSGIVNTFVGASTFLVGDLGTSIYPYGLLNLGLPPRQSAYSVDLSARVSVEVLTPGVTLTSCSGHTYASIAAEVVAVGGGCTPGAPQLTATLPMLGQQQDYTLSNGDPNQAVLFGAALGGPVYTQFGTCMLTEDLTGLITFAAGTTDAAGGSTFAFAIPGTPSLVGAVFTAQELVLTSGGPMLGLGTLSNGLRSTIGD